VPDDPGNHDDRLAAAVAELYEAAPEDFTSRRGELAAAARDAGDRAAAKAIGALRRPTRAAWVVNQLAHTDPGAPARLAELASALNAAQQAGLGPRLRELSAERWALIDTLTAQALAAARLADPPPSLRLEVSQTITAALGDPGVAAEFAAGRLTKAAQWSGFGLAPEWAGPGGDAGAGYEPAFGVETPAKVEMPAKEAPGPEPFGGETPGREAGTVPPQRRAAGRRPAAEREAAAPQRRAPARPTAERREAPATRGEEAAARREEAARRDVAAQRKAAAEERAALEAAERAARRRDQYQEAERTVAIASAAAGEAVAAEDQLEAEVRDLEQRLTRARAELATTRMRARHAETAERRARQALDRLPRE
jgi:hypothetical protein